MAELSRPWSGTVLGDSGPYSDDQWTDVWLSLLGPVVASQGVFRDQFDELNLGGLAASPVTIEGGRALVDGTWYQNSAVVSVAIPTPAANPRIDRIVLRKVWATQEIRITRIAGAEGAVPVPPAITQIDGNTWDLPLWQVLITVAPVLSIYADEREFIGQYVPTGVTDDRVYLEEEFFFGSNLANTDQLNSFEATISGGSINPLTLAGFGSGAADFAHAGGTGDLQVLASRYYKPDLLDARLPMRVRNPNTDANLDRTIGFSEDFTLIPANGLFFRADGAGNWIAVARAGGVEAGTAKDTGQAVDDVWRLFEIRVTGTDVAEFLIDGVVVATHQVNIPSDVALLVVFANFDNGVAPAAQSYMYVDYTTLRGDR